MQKIIHLRQQFSNHGVSGFIIPSTDEFLNEYVPPYLRRLEYVSGFTGSNGVAVIASDKAALFTDGRYLLQARQEVYEGFKVLDINAAISNEWFKDISEKACMGYDPIVHSKTSIAFYNKIAERYGFRFKATANLVVEIWHDRPTPVTKKAFNLEVGFSGASTREKIARVCELIKADYLLLCNPDSICWLLNVRGYDVEYTPLLLAYLIMGKDGRAVLFTDLTKVSHLAFDSELSLSIKPWQEAKEFFKHLVKDGNTVQFDPSKTPAWFYEQADDTIILLEPDPCELLKARKNEVEIQGFRDCHAIDGRTVTKFINWLKAHYKEGITEIGAAEKLLEFRKTGKRFVSPSFETISAFKENGAIIHYHPTDKTDKTITGEGLYLIDSGGQYLNGTTDVTRTICLGYPTDEQIRNYTLVLKGHIALASAVFPIGVTGAQLDALARQYLWKHGLDYPHGTGHGVGHFLSVHEGPQRIVKGKSGSIALEAGMVVSNEPGYYKEGEYGIRLENLMFVQKAKFEGFLQFEILTKVPFEENLIDVDMLTKEETDWLEKYTKLC